ncbi:uncharacterized protein LOC134538625 [Bacillus rossius redtenbacheri]|uniref:uncharacterized protein LOC134538625 n=1 Tax=Bacillus rossius redtenbacheri TaxID=93214 RepID=UPI002FDEDC08
METSTTVVSTRPTTCMTCTNATQGERHAQQPTPLADPNLVTYNRPQGYQGKFTLPEFGGLTHEDPQSFVENCEVRLTRAGIPVDEWSGQASGQLRGTAYEWWDIWGRFGMPWAEFAGTLTRRFDTEQALVDCTSQFYGERQKDGETAEQFVAQKLCLFTRVNPHARPTTALPTVTALLHTGLQPFMRCCRPESVEEYLQQAAAIEQNLRDLWQRGTPGTSRGRLSQTPQQGGADTQPPTRRRAIENTPQTDATPTRVALQDALGLPLCQRGCPNEPPLPVTTGGERPPHLYQLTRPRDSLLRIPVVVDGRAVAALVDTKASLVFVAPHLVQSGKLQPQQAELQLATNTRPGLTVGRATLQVSIRGYITTVIALVVKDLREEIVLGQPWLAEQDVVIETKATRVHIGTQERLAVYAVESLPARAKEAVTLHQILHDVPLEYRAAVDHVLAERKEIFTVSDPLSRTTVTEHHIPTTHNNPVYEPPRGYGFREQRAIREQVAEMHRDGVIEPSNSRYNACIVLAPKTDGSLRFCVDFWPLNTITVSAPPPQISVENAVVGLVRATVFSTLDLKSGYWQFPIRTEDREKTTFTIPDGRKFQFRAMPFGLNCAPATFQGMMTCVLEGYVDRFALAYLHDVIIFSETWEEHIGHLTLVIDHLATQHLTVAHHKCHIGTQEIEFLGHVVSAAGNRAQAGHLKKIAEAEVPRTRKQLQRFVGLINWLRCYVPNFSRTIAPLMDLLLPQSRYRWNDHAQRAFEEVKLAFTQCHKLTQGKPGTLPLPTDGRKYPRRGRGTIPRRPGQQA